MNQSKARVYFNEYNVLMENTTYLPLVSGLLQSAVETFPEIKEQYEFMPFMFRREAPEEILDIYENPAVAAFSVFMWNEQLSLHIARELKQRYPECLIIFGGQQVPHSGTEYLASYPFIDIAVHGEGEDTFVEVMRRSIECREFSDIPGITWRNANAGGIVSNSQRTVVQDNLDIYPSPYLNGLFDEVLERHPDINFQAIIQTNRGCPFTCSYCAWYKSPKLRYYSLERVASEIDWCGRKGIKYVFNADANFGIHRRDLEIARLLTVTKEKYGYPEKFRSCFTKNADDRIYELSMLLLSSKLEKGITLSFQSLNETVLRNIHRENIKLSTYQNLLSRFNAAEVPVYTELIIGLPGEKVESWINGIELIIESGLKGQLFIYPCEIYSNSEMGDAEYQRLHGITTKRVQLAEIHGAIRADRLLPEYQEIVVATASMPPSEWYEMMLLSWLTMTLFSMKLCFFLFAYLRQRHGVSTMDVIQFLMRSNKVGIVQQELDFYRSHLNAVLDGRGGRGVALPECGDIYWDMEEASFLRIVANLDIFYEEITAVIGKYLELRGLSFSDDELAEAVLYQKLQMPRRNAPVTGAFHFTFNFPEYFDRLLKAGDANLEPVGQVIEVNGVDYANDKMRFAKEVILWGRKSDNFLNRVSYI